VVRPPAAEDAGSLLEQRQGEFERERAANLVRPEDVPRGDEEDRPPEIEIPAELPLGEALRLATERNREYRNQVESLEIAALSVLDVRHGFDFRFSSQLAYDLSGGTDLEQLHASGFDIGVSKVLPTGGDLSVDASLDAARGEDDDTTFASAVVASLSQPLLRGAGYEVRFESLTQAERSFVYAIRDFELFRQDFSIRIIQLFFGLIGQRVVIDNTKLRLEQAEFDWRRAKRFFESGRGSELDSFRAEQDYLQAKDRLIREEEQYDILLDRFKIELGLPLRTEFDIKFDRPQFEEIEISLRQAVTAALANRLDLRTSLERVEDRERRVRIARNDLLPDLDLDASYRTSTDAEGRVGELDYGKSSYGVGLSLEIPLDRVRERNAYRRALLDLSRQQRQQTLDEDKVILDVRETIRQLDRIEESIRIQEAAERVEQKRAAAAQIRYAQGEVGNRDLVEARASLLDVRNAIVQRKIDYIVQRLRLLRSMGTLFLDENGVPLP
jgi:outer membrane protein TolC